jgi:tRNA dimethylallyltransferase
MKKVIAIVGPTASGKTELAIKLATKFNGEIICADSRAIYRRLDIGTAKPTPSERKLVRHHLLDLVNVGERFTVAQFQKLAHQAIMNIVDRGKIPFLVGGTGLYVDALLYNFKFPPEADPELRFHLEQESDERLQDILKTIDPEIFRTIDLNNRRRMLRAVEVALQTGQSFRELKRRGKSIYDYLILGINLPRHELYSRIDRRFAAWLNRGLLDEVRWMLDETSPGWAASLGLHYKWFTAYIQGETSYEEALAKSKSSLHSYARRQLTWFKRNKEIRWISSQKRTFELVGKFLGA